MAVTFAKPYTTGPNPDTVFGNKKVRLRTCTLGATYTQAGETVLASDFGLKSFDSCEPLGFATTSSATTAFAVTVKVATGRTSALLFVHGQEPTDATATTIAFADADA